MELKLQLAVDSGRFTMGIEANRSESTFDAIGAELATS